MHQQLCSLPCLLADYQIQSQGAQVSCLNKLNGNILQLLVHCSSNLVCLSLGTCPTNGEAGGVRGGLNGVRFRIRPHGNGNNIPNGSSQAPVRQVVPGNHSHPVAHAGKLISSGLVLCVLIMSCEY